CSGRGGRLMMIFLKSARVTFGRVTPFVIRLTSVFAKGEFKVVSPDDCAPEKCWENCVNTSAPRPAFSREICERATQDGHHRVQVVDDKTRISLGTVKSEFDDVCCNNAWRFSVRVDCGNTRRQAHLCNQQVPTCDLMVGQLLSFLLGYKPPMRWIVVS